MPIKKKIALAGRLGLRVREHALGQIGQQHMLELQALDVRGTGQGDGGPAPTLLPPGLPRGPPATALCAFSEVSKGGCRNCQSIYPADSITVEIGRRVCARGGN